MRSIDSPEALGKEPFWEDVRALRERQSKGSLPRKSAQGGEADSPEVQLKILKKQNPLYFTFIW